MYTLEECCGGGGGELRLKGHQASGYVSELGVTLDPKPTPLILTPNPKP